jgi:hypothetical protein
MTAHIPRLYEAIHKQTAQEMVRDKIVSLIASGVLQIGDALPSEREPPGNGMFPDWVWRKQFGMQTRVVAVSDGVVHSSDKLKLPPDDWRHRCRAGSRRRADGR